MKVGVWTSILYVLLTFVGNLSSAEILRVGPDQRYKLPSDAAVVARDGDIIEINQGQYHGDAAVWKQDNLTIRGLGSGAHILADGVAVEGKGTWVITGKNVAVENMEFSGARVSDRNGAGIRHSGVNLTVRECRFHHNENGILSNKGIGEVLIENSIFYENGYGDGQSHNIYVGRIDRLTVSGSYFHHARIGHNIKTRARENHILYNKIIDGIDGRSSYLVDIPNGGRAILVGNVLQQGPLADNWTLVSYSAESKNSKFGELYLINNTFVNDRNSGIFLNVASPYTLVHAQNNIFLGQGNISNREIHDISNLKMKKEYSGLLHKKLFLDRDNFDYHLVEGSAAIDNGGDPALAGVGDKRPLFEYREIAQLVERAIAGELDIGAFEYTGN